VSDHLIAPGVPDELWFSVFCGALDESTAIARGLLAAAATSAEERRKILVGTFDSTHRTAPPAGYRPCGPPPWHEP
jgi:hypothetical protein